MDSSKLKIVRNSICYHSGQNFQNKIGIILKEYYTFSGYSYENPSSAGGDDKNDGWVKELGIFYQVFSPTNYNSSFGKNVFGKFKEDATGLFENVYVHGLWKTPINEFVFVVNTRDQELPKDSELFCDKVIEELNKKYGSSAKYKLVNFDYIADLLFDLDSSTEDRLMVKLDIDDMINYDNITEKTIISFLDSMAASIKEDMLGDCSGSNYTRISSANKIERNNLVEIGEKINKLICKLHIVENAISTSNRVDPTNNNVTTVTDFVISKYNILSAEKKGVELFDSIVYEMTELTPGLQLFALPAELFVVYIFDKCDIFEKE